LLNISQKSPKEEAFNFQKKLATKFVPIDFQEYLITSLLLFSKKAEFVNLPLEQPQVTKTKDHCDQLAYTHFQKQPVLRFKFAKESPQLIRTFMENLDRQAET
jgi:hypothetical protein